MNLQYSQFQIWLFMDIYKSRYKSVYQDCVRATTQLSSAHGGVLEDTMFSELDAL